ncbi:hypothetical protein K8I28_02725, partial [bacterium]|nr:hypothetical protein [bacterium]
MKRFSILSLLLIFCSVTLADTVIQSDLDPRTKLRIVVLPAIIPSSVKRVEPRTVSGILATELLRIYEVQELPRLEQYLINQRLTLDDLLTPKGLPVLKDSARVDAMVNIDIYRYEEGKPAFLMGKDGSIAADITLFNPYDGSTIWSINSIMEVKGDRSFYHQLAKFFKETVDQIQDDLDDVTHQLEEEEERIAKMEEKHQRMLEKEEARLAKLDAKHKRLMEEDARRKAQEEARLEAKMSEQESLTLMDEFEETGSDREESSEKLNPSIFIWNPLDIWQISEIGVTGSLGMIWQDAYSYYHAPGIGFGGILRTPIGYGLMLRENIGFSYWMLSAKSHEISGIPFEESASAWQLYLESDVGMEVFETIHAFAGAHLGMMNAQWTVSS